MPSDNETDSGSSGTAEAHSSGNCSVLHRHWHQLQRPPTTQGGVTVKTIADAVVTQQRHAQKWTDEDSAGNAATLREEGSGAEYWYVRTVIPGTWAELKDLMLKNFRPPTFLDTNKKHWRDGS
ncbi:hypothetical protein BV898_15138 [Hypsibius exemplaris]|uniref:Uncharacterized protein n=1 Tax=Hypsibius exemplaris TaxID=2072580 RepID=A0A9X6RJY7_HYPEX|nr:hypothetical protein BV898_15138 [Hypsibius exemplaris]